MRKIILISTLVVTLSGCALPWQKQEPVGSIIPAEHTLQNDYQRHIAAMFDRWEKMRNSYFDLLEKVSPSGFDNSTIRFAATVADTGSGEIKIKADAIRNIRDMTMSADIDATGFFSASGSTVRLDALRGSFVTQFTTYFFKLDEFKISGIGVEYNKVQEGYNELMKPMTPHLGKWLEYDRADILKKLITTESNNIGAGLVGAYMDLLGGGEKTKTVLMKHTPIQATADLGKDGEYYRYAIILDHTGAYNLAQELTQTFAGTGIADGESIKKGLQDLSLSGVLSIHESKSEYFKFDGIVSSSGSSEKGHIDIAFEPMSSHIIVSSVANDGKEKELFNYQGNSTDTTGKYTMTASGETLMQVNTTRDGKGLTGVDGVFGPKDEQITLKYDFKDRESFTLFAKNPQTTVLDAKGKMRGDTLASIDATVSPEKDKNLHIMYGYTEDGAVSGKLEGTDIPYAIALSGHAKKNDIDLTLSVQGMTTTLTHKKQSDGTLNGSLKLPVATLDWSGKESKEFLESFKVNLASPVASASLDMRTSDGWLQGPLNVILSSASKKMSMDIKAKRDGKNFSWRVDAPASDFFPKATHLEWDSHIDIRWDKNAKAQVPTNSTSLFDAFPEMKQSLVPKTYDTTTTMPISGGSQGNSSLFSEF